jgi:hypothetical protein
VPPVSQLECPSPAPFEADLARVGFFHARAGAALDAEAAKLFLKLYFVWEPGFISLNANQNAMRARRETPHQGPKRFLPPPPHPLHPLPLPLTVQPKKKEIANRAHYVHLHENGFGEKEMGGVGAGGAGKNFWGLIWFFPPLPHCIWIEGDYPMDFRSVPALDFAPLRRALLAKSLFQFHAPVRPDLAINFFDPFGKPGAVHQGRGADALP